MSSKIRKDPQTLLNQLPKKRVYDGMYHQLTWQEFKPALSLAAQVSIDEHDYSNTHELEVIAESGFNFIADYYNLNSHPIELNRNTMLLGFGDVKYNTNEKTFYIEAVVVHEIGMPQRIRVSVK